MRVQLYCKLKLKEEDLVFLLISVDRSNVLCVCEPHYTEGNTEQRDSVSADNVHIYCR